MGRTARLLVIWRRGEEEPAYLPDAAAVYEASWRGEKRILVFTTIAGRPLVFIAPPVASPFCMTVREKEEVETLKRILDQLNARFYSFCKVSSMLYRATIEETLRAISEEGLIDSA